VRDGNNVDHTIMLTSTTEIKKKEGLAAVRFERMQKSALIPGLPITADLVAHGDQMQATAISFRADDMRTAQQVQAGVAPTSTKVDAMGKRMDDFGKYEAVATAEVMFASAARRFPRRASPTDGSCRRRRRKSRTTPSSCRASPIPPAMRPRTSA
jgi:hypothetical protein